jgi:hypothetical protein
MIDDRPGIRKILSRRGLGDGEGHLIDMRLQLGADHRLLIIAGHEDAQFEVVDQPRLEQEQTQLQAPWAAVLEIENRAERRGGHWGAPCEVRSPV